MFALEKIFIHLYLYYLIITENFNKAKKKLEKKEYSQGVWIILVKRFN